MGGKAVPQRVDAHAFGDPRHFSRLPADQLESGGIHVAAGAAGGKQPVPRAFDAPPGPQHFQQTRRQHRVTILFPFSLFDPDQHACGINVGNLHSYYFGNTQAEAPEGDRQARAIGGHQCGPAAQGSDMPEKGVNLRRAEYHGELIGHAGAGQGPFRPQGFERNVIQKVGRRDKLVHGRGRLLAIVPQMQLILADIFEVEVVGAGLIKLRQSLNLMWCM